MIEEVWKDIDGYEGIYQVNIFGMVKSLNRVITYYSSKADRFVTRTIKEKILTPALWTSKSYFTYQLMKEGVDETVYMHRLIAIYFIPNPDNKPQVNHKDGNKLNCDINNLEWVTHQENADHASEIGLYDRGEEMYNAKLKTKEVIEIKKSALSNTLLCIKYKVSRATIINIRNGKSWAHV